jgi:hypothetical protein
MSIKMINGERKIPIYFWVKRSYTCTYVMYTVAANVAFYHVFTSDIYRGKNDRKRTTLLQLIHVLEKSVSQGWAFQNDFCVRGCLT